MTLPHFDPIPVPLDSALDTMPPPTQNQAGVMDANFAKINGYLAPRRRAWAYRNAFGGLQATFFDTGGWQQLTQWPALTVTVPPAGFLGFYAWMQITAKGSVDNAAQTQCDFGVAVMGPGIAGGGPGVTTITKVGAFDNWISAGSCEFTPAANVVPNQQFTTVCYFRPATTQQWNMDLCSMGIVFIT